MKSGRMIPILLALAAPAAANPQREEATQPMAAASSTPPRIPLREPEEMTPEEREQYLANPMARINLSRLFSLAPTMSQKVTELNMAMATSITVPPLEREIVALAVLHLERGEYEIAQHDVVAERMGIPRTKVDAIANERYTDPMFTDREKALLAFTRQSVRSVRIDDAVFNAVAAFYDRRQIVETLFVIGNYMMILRVSEAAEVPLDGVSGADFWKDRK